MGASRTAGCRLQKSGMIPRLPGATSAPFQLVDCYTFS